MTTSSAEQLTPAHSDHSSPGGSGFGRLKAAFGWRYFVVSGLARLPQSMLTIGALTYVAAGAKDFTTPGAVAAIAGIGVAIGAPISGAATDRWGQRRVLFILAIAYLLALGGVLWAGAPRGGEVTLGPTLVISALIAGMVVPQVAPMTRVRWIRRFGSAADASTLDLALGYESTIDEMAYVFGPALVGIVAAAAGAPLPLVIAAVLTLITIPAFALDRSARLSGPGVHDQEQARGAERIAVGFLVIALGGMLSIGTIFGSLATTVTVFADETGHPGTGGLLYAALGVTSGLGALSVSRWPTRWTAQFRWLLSAVLTVPATLLLLWPSVPWQMAIAMLLVGAPVGPILVTIFAAAGQRTPTRRLGLVMTLLSAGVTLGTSIGNLLGGTVADGSGHRAALMVTCAASLSLLLFGALFAGHARSHRRR